MWQQTGGTAPPPATTYYDIEFAGDVIDTTVTCDGSVTADWIRSVRSFHRRLRTRPIVGLDCEWRPNFEPGGCNYVATLQLCSSRKCLILQLQHMEFIPQPSRTSSQIPISTLWELESKMMLLSLRMTMISNVLTLSTWIPFAWIIWGWLPPAVVAGAWG
ncbi:hypothetical protein J5N97_014107 [Dioscorea zingiberensis]|uniref:Werner Syndrome-like exonuclease n=1 Tax=Dioscorea zingiberensis TaxID=325984 RepID=A0A9D5HJG4_9LILI|nr:hypothetical protein J5N97_014107 [Dioscorea zingiberensis]